jgi:hypothetical protein
MDSDNEFSQFVFDEIINSSSSDDEIYDDTAHIVVEDLVNNPGRIGSIEGHEIVQRERLLWHDLLYKDYFSNNPTFNATTFRRRFVYLSLILIHYSLYM